MLRRTGAIPESKAGNFYPATGQGPALNGFSARHFTREVRAPRALQLPLEPLVAAVEVVDAARPRSCPAAAQPGQHQRRRGPQVASPSPARRRGRGRPSPPRSCRRRAMSAPSRRSSGTCMKRFSKMVSVMTDGPVGEREQHHHLRLHVGGEARDAARSGRRPGRARPAPRQRMPARRRSSPRRRPRAASPPAPRGGPGTAPCDRARRPRVRRAGHQEGAGLDAVGDDVVVEPGGARRRPRCG